MAIKIANKYERSKNVFRFQHKIPQEQAEKITGRYGCLIRHKAFHIEQL